jgi:hypothetical protein
LEDDISMEFVKYWNKSISTIIKNAPSDWNIIMLTYISQQPLVEEYTRNYNGSISCASAYLINRKSAINFMNDILFNEVYYLDENRIHTADDYIFGSTITYVYKYCYFTFPSDNTSTIHNDHLNYHYNSKMNMVNEWKKYYKNNSLKQLINVKKIIYNNKVNIFLIILIILIVGIIIIYIKNNNNNNDIDNDPFI